MMAKNGSPESYLKADKFAVIAHNGQLIPGMNLPYINSEKIRVYRDEAIMIYNSLHPASHYLSQRLKFKIDHYQRYL